MVCDKGEAAEEEDAEERRRSRDTESKTRTLTQRCGEKEIDHFGGPFC